MSGLVLLFAVAMIAAVIVWSIMNDKVDDVGETRGLFAMRHAVEPERDGESSWRPKSADRDDDARSDS